MESDLAWASTLTLTGSATGVVDQINANSILAAGSLRASCRPTPSLLAHRERTGGAVLRCGQGGDGRRSGASFWSRSETRDRRFEVRW